MHGFPFVYKGHISMDEQEGKSEGLTVYEAFNRLIDECEIESKVLVKKEVLVARKKERLHHDPQPDGA